MDGALKGLRVLDFGQAAVGPISTTYLGELGADVIKVEQPAGDMVRRGKPTLRGMGHTFLGNNLTKRGIVLNLKNPVEQQIALKLIATADILVENFRSPEVMQRLGLGYSVLAKVNPRLIYLQSSAYGPTGPMHGMTNNDWFAQASGGATSINGEAGGRGQWSRGTSTMDWVGAFINLEGLLAALYMRERTGRGMMLQTSQYQSVVTAGTTRLAEYLATGVAPQPAGSARPNVVPDQAFATADGFISVSVPHNGFWPKLCAAIERPDLAADARFSTNQKRVANRAVLIPMLESVFAARPSAEWIQGLRTADVPVGELQRGRTLSASLLAHPQAQAEGVISVLETPWGPMATAEPHWRFDKTQARISRPSPAQGEHQREILAELGMEQEAAAG